MAFSTARGRRGQGCQPHALHRKVDLLPRTFDFLLQLEGSSVAYSILGIAHELPGDSMLPGDWVPPQDGGLRCDGA